MNWNKFEYNAQRSNLFYSFDCDEFQDLLIRIGYRSAITENRLCVIYQLAKKYEKYPAAELGVWRGGSAYIICSFIKNWVYLYDTFEGMPEVETGLDSHSQGDFMTSYNEVKKFLSIFDNNIMIKGKFPDSVVDLQREFGFVHLDGDLYSTTKAALEYFYPRIIRGGSILLDDYGFASTLGCTKAVNEFLQDKADLFLELGNGQGLIIKGGLYGLD